MSRNRQLAEQLAPTLRIRNLYVATLCICSFCAANLTGSACGQVPDPGDSTKVLNLTTFATFSAVANSKAIDLTHPKDGSGRVFISTNEGKIHAFSSTGASLGTFLDLNASGVLPDFDSSLGDTTWGLSYMAFHPDYGKTSAPGEGKLYTIYKTDEPGLRSPDYSGAGLPTKPGTVLSQYAITEWTVDSNDPNKIDTSSRREVIRFEISGPGESTHSVGQIAFNPFAQSGESDYGVLYIPLGDMFNGGPVPNWQHVQDEDNPFGKILRIDPLANESNAYSIPVDNPFNDGGSLLDNDSNTEEIAAWGFRYPQNMSFAKDSSGNSRLVVFDIGADDYEEVNIVDVGDNHGWTRYDGPADGNLATTLNLPLSSTLEFPATSYDHNIPNVPGASPTAESTAITGGFVVSDPNDASFQNQLLFGDLARGAFFHADFDDLVAADTTDNQALMFVMNASLDGSTPGAFPPLVGSVRGDARFGVDESGRLFVISKQTNTVFVTDLIADQNPVVPAACDFDSDLSCTVADINLMFGQGDLVTGVATTAATEKFDLIDDNLIDDADITEWLSQSATENGFGSPYLRGDTDDLDPNTPTRTVDITDFQNFLTGFTGSGITWEVGNFDGDNDVDITDFSNHLLPNFILAAGGTYGAGQAIPEPQSVLLLGVGGLWLTYVCCGRRAAAVLSYSQVGQWRFPQDDRTSNDGHSLSDS